MSRSLQHAKKPKTVSALKSGLTGISLIIISIFALLLMIVLPAKSFAPHAVCFHRTDCLQVNDATTIPEQRQGLSYLPAMPDSVGMLFDFGNSSTQCMWMKDMRFNLDMIWLDAEGRVENIVGNISPASYPQTICFDDSRYVLEIHAHMADKLGIRIGDSMRL